MAADWAAIRAQFPALTAWTYLNTATFGQIPVRAVEAAARHFARRDRLACSDFLQWFDDADRIRALIARLIHCEPSDVAFIQNASTALSLLLGGMRWREGDRIVTLEGEFPNNLYYPSLFARHGVELAEVAWPDFYAAITPRTRLVAVSMLNYTNGFRPPLEEISAYLRERGVLLYVDGTQGVGALELDVAKVRPDMLAVHAYKWLLSPNGAGFMYVAPSLRPQLEPNVVGWRSHKGWRSVDNLHQGVPVFTEAAEKYEGGMLTFTVLYSMAESLEMLLEAGPPGVERRVMELAGRASAALRELGARLPGDEAPHFDSPIIAARFEGRDASLLARRLKERRVLVSARHGHLRVSTHLYNNEEDIERLSAELRGLL